MKHSKRQPEWPEEHAHYLFKRLSRSERFTISLVYFKTWRRIVNLKTLKKNERAYFKHYLKEIHARYYLRVVKGGGYVKTSRLILNYLISKANENIRAILLSLEPYNLTIFVQAIRSQIELNALLKKYIADANYHQKHIELNEDRSKVKEFETVININTLVNKLGNETLPYKSCYDELSLILHPNPSAIKFYAQAEGTPTPDGEGLFQPRINYYFDETITSTKKYDEWFNNYLWLFLSLIEHYLILIDSLKNDFYINDMEKEQFQSFVLSEVINNNKKEILKAANSAIKNNDDVTKSVNHTIQRILKNTKDNDGE